MHAYKDCCPFIKHIASHHSSVYIHPERDLTCQDHQRLPTDLKKSNYMLCRKKVGHERVCRWCIHNRLARCAEKVPSHCGGGSWVSRWRRPLFNWEHTPILEFSTENPVSAPLCIQLHTFLTYNTLTHIVPLKCGAWCSYTRRFCRLIVQKHCIFFVLCRCTS